MTHEIAKVGVIGAGVMGAGIAAQIANAGVPVLLLDVVAKDGNNRSAIAEGAVARLLKTEPAPFMSPKAARLVETGNIEDDLARLSACDWIIEAVVERLDVKQALYRRIEQVRRPGAAISSNTSTIPLRALADGMSESFRRAFLITHFFNPPRYMRLLEIVGGDADGVLLDRIGRFCDRALGKSIVRCKDTPGFIGNRLGIFWITAGVAEAIDLGISVEEADALIGKPMGFPKTGIFGLLDLVGLDLMPHVNASMARTLAPGDPFHAVDREFPMIGKMIADGYTGRKGKGGFYRINRAEGKRKEAVNLATGAYHPAIKPDLPEAKLKDLRDLLTAPTRYGQYAWRVLGQTLSYAASLIPEAADDVVSVDAAMRLGYGWKWGPFELIDRLGAAWLAERLAADGMPVPALLREIGTNVFYGVAGGRLQHWTRDGYRDVVRPDGVLLLEDIKRASQPVAQNVSAALWDIGDGVACFEFTSKNNALDDQTMAMLGRAIEIVNERFRALVIYNEGTNFCVGANIGLMLAAAQSGAWSDIEKLTEAGQAVYRSLKDAPFPVVSAAFGMALGGGCEILLHSDAIQAHAETYAGLVEGGVGLVPAWGGCKEMLTRWATLGKLPKGPMPAVAKAFELISTARVAKSAADAMDMLILRPGDGITMNRDRLLADAKAKALQLAEGYEPPAPAALFLPGLPGRLSLEAAAERFHKIGLATDHDLAVAKELAVILTGGDTDALDSVSEEALLALERAGFMRLAKTAPTLARIQHILETGKPLRN